MSDYQDDNFSDDDPHDNAPKQLMKILDRYPNGRFHFSKKKIDQIIDRSSENRHLMKEKMEPSNYPTMKPGGLWYSFYKSYSKYYDPNYMPTTGYIYNVIIDADFTNNPLIPRPDRILQLADKESIVEFSKKYKTKNVVFFGCIDWILVKADFAGIEFPKYNKEWDRGYQDIMLWYDLIDFPSGCIWRTDNIELKYIGENLNTH